MVTKKEKAMEKEIRETTHKVWLAGLGALSVAEEEGTKLFSNLVDKGRKFEKKLPTLYPASATARKSVAPNVSHALAPEPDII